MKNVEYTRKRKAKESEARGREEDANHPARPCQKDAPAIATARDIDMRNAKELRKRQRQVKVREAREKERAARDDRGGLDMHKRQK